MPVPLIIHKAAIEGDLLAAMDEAERMWRDADANGDPLGIAADLRIAYDALFRARVKVDDVRGF